MVYTRPWPLPPRDALATVHQITDSHMGYGDPYNVDDTAKKMAAARDMSSVFIRHLDGWVHTGDITDDGGGTDPGEATQDARSLDWLAQVDPGLPSVWCPGNHDLRDRDGDIGSNPAYTTDAWEYAYGRPANGVVDMGGVRVVHFAPPQLTWDQDQANGWAISPERLSWIDQQCQAADRPVILANHYPIAEVNESHGWTASSYLQPRGNIAGIIDANPTVAGMICGHTHYETTDVRSVEALTIGSRRIIHIVGPSLALTGPPMHTGYADSVSVPQRSLYISVLDPTRWQIRYRSHTPGRWEGVDGWRVTTIDSITGEETRSQGGTA